MNAIEALKGRKHEVNMPTIYQHEVNMPTPNSIPLLSEKDKTQISLKAWEPFLAKGFDGKKPVLQLLHCDGKSFKKLYSKVTISDLTRPNEIFRGDYSQLLFEAEQPRFKGPHGAHTLPISCGIVTGSLSGITVLDLDLIKFWNRTYLEDKRAWLSDLEAAQCLALVEDFLGLEAMFFESLLDEVFHVWTPKGGLHLYFKDAGYKTTQHDSGIDVLGESESQQGIVAGYGAYKTIEDEGKKTRRFYRIGSALKRSFRLSPYSPDLFPNAMDFLVGDGEEEIYETTSMPQCLREALEQKIGAKLYSASEAKRQRPVSPAKREEVSDELRTMMLKEAIERCTPWNRGTWVFLVQALKDHVDAEFFIAIKDACKEPGATREERLIEIQNTASDGLDLRSALAKTKLSRSLKIEKAPKKIDGTSMTQSISNQEKKAVAKVTPIKSPYNFDGCYNAKGELRESSVAKEISKVWLEYKGRISKLLPFLEGIYASAYKPWAQKEESEVFYKISPEGIVSSHKGFMPGDFRNETHRALNEISKKQLNDHLLGDSSKKTLIEQAWYSMPRINREDIAIWKFPEEHDVLAWHQVPVRPNLDFLPPGWEESDPLYVLHEIAPHWMSQLSRMNNHKALVCYFGSFLSKDEKPQQYLWLKGEGNDGKTEIMRFFLEFFQGGAVWLDGQSLGNPDKFFTARLENKFVALCDDVQDGGVVSDRHGFWKTLTGDTLSVEQKFRNAYTAKNHAQIIVTSNTSPQTRPDIADKRRAIISECKTVPQGERVADFYQKLLAEAEPFMSYCYFMWEEFKGKQRLCPVDDAVFAENLSTVYEKEEDAIRHYFEVFSREEIQAAWDEVGKKLRSKNKIPSTPMAILQLFCNDLKLDYKKVVHCLKNIGCLPSEVIKVSTKAEKRCVGIVPKEVTAQKYLFKPESFDLI
jgi:hypothetical protein